MSHPRSIDINLVIAQQARRILDRLVGYKLSPFLWRKIRKGLSAGRVQSVAVKMICDRENEIRAFVSQEYWSIDGKFSANGERKTFAAKLNTVDGEKPELKNKEQADEILKRLEGAEFVIDKVKKSVHRKSPAAPFTTSTLQQECVPTALEFLMKQGQRHMILSEKNMAISISQTHRKNIKLRATLRTLTKPSDQHTQR